MIVRGYVVFEPGMDRPCFSSTFPEHYKKKPGAKVFSFDLSVPEFDFVDGRLAAVASPVEPSDAQRTA
jgi:hypothetical protein